MERCYKFYFKKILIEYRLKIKEGKIYLYNSLMKIVSFMRWCGKYSADRHGANVYAIRHLALHASYIRLDKPTLIMNNLLLFHVNNSYITAPQYYTYTYIVCLVLCSC